MIMAWHGFIAGSSAGCKIRMLDMAIGLCDGCAPDIIQTDPDVKSRALRCL